jgi:hypothetical protein
VFCDEKISFFFSKNRKKSENQKLNTFLCFREGQLSL